MALATSRLLLTISDCADKLGLCYQYYSDPTGVAYVGFNLVCAFFCLIPKVPYMHGKRLFGLNSGVN